MKRIIRLTERDLTRIVKRTIREMKFSDDEEFDSENEFRPYDVCLNMEYLVHDDFATGMLTKEKVIEILNDYKSTASRYLRKKLISSKEYQKISDCYEESMSELENPEYNKLNEYGFPRIGDERLAWERLGDELFGEIYNITDTSNSTEEFKSRIDQFFEDEKINLKKLPEETVNDYKGFVSDIIKLWSFEDKSRKF
jgi:hypothetical protein